MHIVRLVSILQDTSHRTSYLCFHTLIGETQSHNIRCFTLEIINIINQDFSPAVHLSPYLTSYFITLHWRSLPKYNYCLSLYDNLTIGKKVSETNRVILKYGSLHNHFEKEFDASTSIVKHKIKIKDEIRINSIPFRYKKPKFYEIPNNNLPISTPSKIIHEMGFLSWGIIKPQLDPNGFPLSAYWNHPLRYYATTNL
ncbi:hypothetical protein H8356DRAFT_1329275 [Neocallimastix lanati (nom. inval.)]|nr:hypothetical protein H8356DRAFT_1329275 [Neocallimastix sp. JGI-2020a]